MPVPSKPSQDHPLVKEKEAITDPAKPPLPDEATIAFFAANNVPYCKTCGQQVCTDANLLPVCPYNVLDCPVTAHS